MMQDRTDITTVEKIAVTAFLGTIAAVYSLEIIIIVVSIIGLLTTAKWPLFWSAPAVLIHSAAIFGLACFAYGMFIEPYWIQVKNIKIKSGKLSNSAFRLVHFSDLHCSGKPRIEKKLVNIVNETRPDIIVFTGDCLLLNTPEALPVFKKTLQSLNAGIAKVAVLGNVDIWYLPGLDYFGGTGFEQLDGKTVEVKKDDGAIYISGLSCEHPDKLPGLLKNLPENHFNIFLYHKPDLIEDIDGFGVDLYLCGHTHGGQVRLPFFGALITLSKFGKKYEQGLYKVGETTLYINRGIGPEGGGTPRVRFLARPEITIFDIAPA